MTPLRNRRTLSVQTLDDRLTPATLLGLTDADSLLRFDSASPGTTTPVSITGLNGGETVLGFDFRPANGLLYAVTNQNRLLTIDPLAGTATPVATLTADPTDSTNPFTALNGTAFGVDFNPVSDRLRVVSDTNQNLRVNPTTGAVITDSDLNPGTPDVVAAAYSNNFAGTVGTTLYGLDAASNSLVIQNPPNNGTLTTVGAGLGVDVTLSAGFDIVTFGGPVRTSTAFATTSPGGSTGLYTIDLTAGLATLVGTIGSGTTPIRGLAVVPAGTLDFAVEAFPAGESSGAVAVTVTRTGGSLGSVSVNFAIAAGTATAGQDFTSGTGTITFAGGDTTPKIVQVTILDDRVVEGIETVNLVLSGVTNGAVLGARGTATVTIRDDESPSDHLYAVTAANTLLEFDAAAPGTILRSIPLQGLAPGDVVEGIDVRPATGALYALVVHGTAGRLLTINPDTGATSEVASLTADPTDTTNPFTALSGVDFGFDFNPTNDRIRIVSDADENLAVNPDTGLVTTQTTITGGTPNVVGSAYTNSFAGAGSSLLFAIDSGTDSLYVQNPPANGVLTLVGALGFDTAGQVGFEISPFGNEAFVTLTAPSATSSRLFLVNLATGATTLLGTVGGGSVMNGLTSVPAGFLNFSAASFTGTENGGLATITVTRTGGSTGTITVGVTAADGTATSGLDYLAPPGTLVFADGDTTPRTFPVFLLPDGIAAEGDETVLLSLGNPTGGAFPGTVPTAVLTIHDTTPIADPLPPSRSVPFLVGGPSDGSVRTLAVSSGSLALGNAFGALPGLGVNARTAVADVTGDGVPDFIVGAGPGSVSRVVVLNGTDRATVVTFDAFEPSFDGGVFVAAADIDGDGKAEVIVTPDESGGPVVAVYRGAQLAAGVGGQDAQLSRFFGIAGDANFRGGCRPALGDLDGDGAADLVVSAGVLGGPRIAVFDGQSLKVGNPNPGRLVGDFFAFEDTLRNGAFVAVGDVTGDGHADVAFGGGPGGAPRVRLLDGKSLLAAPAFSSVDAIAATAQRANFFAGDAGLRGGVRLALHDVDGDGVVDLATGSGASELSRVRVYKSATLLGAAHVPDQDFDPFGAALTNGVFVG